MSFVKPSFKIGDRMVGYDYEPLVIAEIGINHEGSLAVAKQMVDEACRAGAEIIKHQTHIVADEMSDEAKSVIPGNADVSIYEIMARCALNEADEIALKQYVESKGMMFISTPFSREAAYRLERMGVLAYKIGSGECNNYPLIKLVASFGKPMIVSTGMNSIDSVKKSVQIMETAGVPYALLHCTNVYPTPPELVRLGAIGELQAHFPNAVVGLSDHCVDNYVCMGAVAVGASILERHFTDNFKRPGPDINCSMDGDGMADLIKASHQIAKARGGKKGAVQAEKVTSDFAFASVVAYKDIKAGEVLTEENLWVRRPGTGDFLADKYDELLGIVAKVDIKKGSQLKHFHLT
ncbi:polysialic acid capsule biosynthesis protein SiaC [Moraxella macacae 0408225]|uniref:Polysialic acid capsule biosynthesis protein SiaC n=1 Tax=Moraxella macacae 0408225 TaxID=1230338 RepID=L2F942_9GAMM|nr:N-acetylneuraminate synthase family protein [Moraxella macacae]ELA09291.1 polysialic acid capsule biosynthesis protein SiaC [Moraxella macacae 0408225]